MKPGFRLNLHDRSQNPLFESHDPSMMWDEKSGFYYSYSTDAAITSPYRQGIPIRKSRDLINFTYVGHALSDAAVAQGRNNGSYPPTSGFWAPFAERCGEEYRLYYSATKAFGSSESRIWLAVSESPEGPFENRGVVADTWNTPDTEPNAIDPHVAEDGQGRKYLIYGSFFGGIYIKELDPRTGLALDPDTKFQGKCIARRPDHSYIDGPEGPAVIYVPETGYYYLFLSYGWLGDDYDIRVGRSRNIEGPYLDPDGWDLAGQGLGFKLAGSYQFSAKAPCAVSVSAEGCGTEDGQGRQGTPISDPAWEFGGFRGPGHGVPFRDPVSGSFFFVHHVRDGAACFRRREQGPPLRDSYRIHYMVVRRMYFADAWPVFSPEPFAGEAPEAVPLREWEASHTALPRGQEQGSFWEWLEFLPDDNKIALSRTGPLPETLDPGKTLVFSCYDFENSRETLAFTGISTDGRAVWGKSCHSRTGSFEGPR